MRISAPPAARPLLGSRAVRGPEELLDPERETTRRRMHALAPPAAGPARGPQASGGPEELRDSDRACGPFAVTSDRLLSIHTAGHGQ